MFSVLLCDKDLFAVPIGWLLMVVVVVVVVIMGLFLPNLGDGVDNGWVWEFDDRCMDNGLGIRIEQLYR